jgi:hypothetical protein
LNAQSAEGRMECYASRKKLLGLFMLTIAMVAAAIYCTTFDDPISKIIGGTGAAFFGLALIILPARFLRRGPTVIIDHRGIEDRRLGIGIILWDDIASIDVQSIQSASFIRVEVIDPETYVPWMPWWSRYFARINEQSGFSPINIGFVDLEPDMEEAWKYLQHRWTIHLRRRRDAMC